MRYLQPFSCERGPCQLRPEFPASVQYSGGPLTHGRLRGRKVQPHCTYTSTSALYTVPGTFMQTQGSVASLAAPALATLLRSSCGQPSWFHCCPCVVGPPSAAAAVQQQQRGIADILTADGRPAGFSTASASAVPRPATHEVQTYSLQSPAAPARCHPASPA